MTDTTSNVLQALQNIAALSIEAYENVQLLSRETTRILSIYSSYIGTENEGENYKEIYDKTKCVFDVCSNIEHLIESDLKDSIQDMLLKIGE